MTSRTSVRTFLGAVLAVVALVMTGLAMPATAASTGSVKGVVTVEGAPLDFARVQLFRAVFSDRGGDITNYRRLKTVNTGKDGKFSFSGLSPQPKNTKKYFSYAVVATDRSGKTVRHAAYVVVKKGKTITQNFQLKPAAIITGKVTRSDGGSPAGFDVRAGIDDDASDPGYAEELRPNRTTVVRPDGTFTLSGLQPGAYPHVAISGGDVYGRRCYEFTAGVLTRCDLQTGTLKFTLTAGERRALSPTVLTEKVSTMGGKVTDTSGRPIKGIGVRATGQDRGLQYGSDVSRSTGRFSMSGLESGAYVVRFNDSRSVWATQYAGGATQASGARIFNIVGGTKTTGVNVRLKSRAAIATKTTVGKGSVKIVFKITRKATGSASNGTMTLALGSNSKKVKLVKGKATIALKSLPKGKQKFTATYSGTSSTQGLAKSYSIAVK